ncbi:MAG: hypothetical protein IJY38_01045, partial [Clostridia bacterium]|nr:hypothetical protein [Clostridia bacterium]
ENYTASEWSAEVTYNAPASELKFATLDNVSLIEGADGNVTYELSGTALAVTTGASKNSNYGINFTYNGLTFEGKTLSFKITNNSNETLQLGVKIVGCNVNVVEGANVEAQSIDGVNSVLVTVAAGESVIVTLQEKNSWEHFTNGGTISLRPFIKSNDFDGTFTIGEIYNGERT